MVLTPDLLSMVFGNCFFWNSWFFLLYVPIWSSTDEAFRFWPSLGRLLGTILTHELKPLSKNGVNQSGVEANPYGRPSQIVRPASLRKWEERKQVSSTKTRALQMFFHVSWEQHQHISTWRNHKTKARKSGLPLKGYAQAFHPDDPEAVTEVQCCGVGLSCIVWPIKKKRMFMGGSGYFMLFLFFLGISGIQKCLFSMSIHILMRIPNGFVKKCQCLRFSPVFFL